MSAITFCFWQSYDFMPKMSNFTNNFS